MLPNAKKVGAAMVGSHKKASKKNTLRINWSQMIIEIRGGNDSTSP